MTKILNLLDIWDFEGKLFESTFEIKIPTLFFEKNDFSLNMSFLENNPIINNYRLFILDKNNLEKEIKNSSKIRILEKKSSLNLKFKLTIDLTNFPKEMLFESLAFERHFLPSSSPKVKTNPKDSAEKRFLDIISYCYGEEFSKETFLKKELFPIINKIIKKTVEDKNKYLIKSVGQS